MLSRDTVADPRLAPRAHKRADVLRESFPELATALDRSSGLQLDSGLVADFVALGWLRWEQGSLVLTAAGVQASAARRVPH